MAIRYRFDRTARSERYFVNTMLLHLIMADNFYCLKSIFKAIFQDEITPEVCSSTDFEIVTELDALRDGSVQNYEVKKLYRNFKRVAVPDIFLRWSTKCLVIEAKFFTNPSSESLKNQISNQKQAINHVKKFTKYHNASFKFASLTINSEALDTDGIFNLSWSQVLSWIDIDKEQPDDILYAWDIVACALERSVNEIKGNGSITYEKLKFRQLMNDIPRLIAERKIYVGFVGGVSALMNSNINELESRSHYKVSEIRWTDNWISLDIFLRKVFEARGLFHQNNDETE